MGSDDLFWKRKKTYSKRKIGARGTPKETFLIVCEGKCTEPNYFKSFRITSVNIKVEGLGCNTLSLVKRTIEYMEEAKKQDLHFDQVWSVFDRNSHPAQYFNNALGLAESNNIRIAYSNEAFELWYLLHFHYLDNAISRKAYISKLKVCLGHKYKKNSTTVYEELLDKQHIAIRNANNLLEKYGKNYNKERANPSTTVHLLVKELNKHL